MWHFLPHLLFPVPPRSDDLYYLALRIKEGVFRSHPIKPGVFHKRCSCALIAQQPCCGREASQCKDIFPGCLLSPDERSFSDAGECNYCLSAEMMHTLNDHVRMCSLYVHVKLELSCVCKQ